MRCGSGAGDESDRGLKPATLPKDATDGRMLVVCIMTAAVRSECRCPHQMMATKSPIDCCPVPCPFAPLGSIAGEGSGARTAQGSRNTLHLPAANTLSVRTTLLCA